MQDVYEGKKDLKNEEVSLIFKDCVQKHLTEIRGDYGSYWNKLRVNERLCIQSLYFNNPNLVNNKSDFRKHIGNYVETSNVAYLKLAVKEVQERSNPKKSKGLQNRREAKALLLASYLCWTFTKPCEDPASRIPTIVNCNDTKIPLGTKGSFEKHVNLNYFIWRTRMDSRVREGHAKLEGKVFPRDRKPMPGDDSCRCHAEDVPDNMLILDKVDEQKTFNLYLRTGIKLNQMANLENKM